MKAVTAIAVVGTLIPAAMAIVLVVLPGEEYACVDGSTVADTDPGKIELDSVGDKIVAVETEEVVLALLASIDVMVETVATVIVLNMLKASALNTNSGILQHVLLNARSKVPCGPVLQQKVVSSH
jgi:hypothetical protein